MIKLPIWDYRNWSFISAWSSWCVCVDGLRLVLLFLPPWELEARWRRRRSPLAADPSMLRHLCKACMWVAKWSWMHAGAACWQLTLPCWDALVWLACGWPCEAECTTGAAVWLLTLPCWDTYARFAWGLPSVAQCTAGAAPPRPTRARECWLAFVHCEAMKCSKQWMLWRKIWSWRRSNFHESAIEALGCHTQKNEGFLTVEGSNKS